jgi:hypothetical protein
VELVSLAHMLPVVVGSRGMWSTGTGLWSADFSCGLGEGLRSAAAAATLETSSHLVHSTSAETDGLPELAPSLAIRIFDESSAFARLSRCFSACELLVSGRSHRTFSTACDGETAAESHGMSFVDSARPIAPLPAAAQSRTSIPW